MNFRPKIREITKFAEKQLNFTKKYIKYNIYMAIKNGYLPIKYVT